MVGSSQVTYADQTTRPLLLLLPFDVRRIWVPFSLNGDDKR